MPEKQTDMTGKLSLDAACRAIQHWRENKSDYPGSGIPNDIWNMMFTLENSGHDKKMLQRMLGVNPKQYERKNKELTSANKENPIASNTENNLSTNISSDLSLEFKDITESMREPPPLDAQLNQEIKEAKSAVSHLKSPVDCPNDYLDRTTIVVECFDPQGFRLRIHMTADSIESVMEAFRKGGAKIC